MLQVFVYDTQRGAREGEELDKILAFYPSSATAEQQQASLPAPPPRALLRLTRFGRPQAASGLAEALAGLVGIFSPAPLQSLTATLHRHAFLPCEAGLWFCLVREREGAAEAQSV